MKKIAIIAGCLVTTFAHAQSTGIPWQNGRILTAPMLQSLDQAKMNINSLGKPGFAPQLNALGQITNPVVGDVSQAKATADGQTLVEVTAKVANAVQKADVGATVAPLDANKMMYAPVSGAADAGTYGASLHTYTTTSVGACIDGYGVTDDNKWGAGYTVGATVTQPNDGTIITVTSVSSTGAITGYSTARYATSLTDHTGQQGWDASPPAGATHACFRVLATTDNGTAGGKKTILPRFVQQVSAGDYAGMTGDASDGPAIAALASAYNGSKITLPPGKWPVGVALSLPFNRSAFLSADGNISGIPNFSYSTPVQSFAVPYAGDGIELQVHNANGANHPTLYRVDKGGVNNSYMPVSDSFYVNSDPNHNGGFTDVIHPHRHSFTASVPGSVGTTAGCVDEFMSDGTNGGNNADYGHQTKFYAYGKNWMWAHALELDEFGSRDYSALNKLGTPITEMWMQENNYNGIGLEPSATSYDLDKMARTGILVSTGLYDRAKRWSASTNYDSNILIVVKNPADSLDYMFTTSAGGTSGTVAPTWVFTDGATVSDGTVTWSFRGIKKYQIGKAYTVSTNDTLDGYHVEMGAAFQARIRTFNTVFALDKVTYTTPIHAWTRVNPDAYLDLSSDGLSAATQNNHRIGWNSTDQALEYFVGQTSTAPMWSVYDSGAATLAGKLTINSNATDNAIEMGSTKTASTSYIDAHSSGISNDYDARIQFSNGSKTSGQGDVIISSKSLQLAGAFQTSKKTKTQILAMTEMQEGWTLYDTDDHAEVTYRCPTASTCGWFPLQYGAALSN